MHGEKGNNMSISFWYCINYRFKPRAFCSSEISMGNTTISGYEKAFDPGSMNLSVKPGDDFYAYANGAWIKSHTVPVDKSRLVSLR